jgi:hypothetical protein
MADENIDYLIDRFIGCQVTEVTLEPWSVRVDLDDNYLHIEGDWILLNVAGETIDRSMDYEQRTKFHLWRITGHIVNFAEFINQPPYRLTIRFENGFQMNILANSDGYEDWSLSSSNEALVVCNDDVLTVWSDLSSIRSVKKRLI